MKEYIKLFVIAISLMALGAGIVSAQTPPVSVTIDTATLYQHGYNSGHADVTESESPREAVDSVMVGAVMPYFIMPDANYNQAYFAQNPMNYGNTSLTESKFTWIVPDDNGTLSDTTGTSPLVSIEWKKVTASPFTVSMTETPQYNGGDLCEGEAAEIEVIVIAQPTAGFTETGKIECVDVDPATTQKTLSIPITVTSSSSQIEVTYTADGTSVTKRLTAANNLEITVNAYGTHTVTIDSVTDRIARKCSLNIPVTTNNTYTYTIFPQPQKGKVYHIPNMFE
jgi:hypothetical protein